MKLEARRETGNGKFQERSTTRRSSRILYAAFHDIFKPVSKPVTTITENTSILAFDFPRNEQHDVVSRGLNDEPNANRARREKTNDSTRIRKRVTLSDANCFNFSRGWSSVYRRELCNRTIRKLLPRPLRRSSGDIRRARAIVK